MSYNTFTPIVTDGLILSLDAANTKSYSGTGTSWLDLTKNTTGGTLTNMGTTGFSSSNSGVIVFDGVNDFVLIPSKTVIDLNSSFSIEYWSKLNTSTFMAWVHVGIQTINNSFSIGQYSGPGSIITKFQKTTNDRAEFRFVSTPQLNTWEHYVITYDGSGSGNGFNLYKNSSLNNKVGSVLVNTGTVSGISINNLTYIGYSASGTMGFLNGNISKLNIYNRVLLSSEVLQNYNATKWRFI